MDLKLEGKQIQTLSPRMIQSMQILQMDSLELGRFLTELAQENPVLELSEPSRLSTPLSVYDRGMERKTSASEDDTDMEARSEELEAIVRACRG